MKKKYKFLRNLCVALSVVFIISLIISLIRYLSYNSYSDYGFCAFFGMISVIFMYCASVYDYKIKASSNLPKVEFNQFHFDFEEKNEVDTDPNIETYTERYHSENNEINVALLNIGVKNKELFEDTLGEKVARYLKAINDQDEKEIKDVCSGEIAERTIKSIKENDKLGYDLKIENIEIINSTLIDVIPIKKNPIIDIKVIMTIKESIVKDSEKSTSTQSDAKVYKVRFNKKDKSQKDYKCDNCGAELSAITEICPYCRTNTEFIEERNWFITSIKEVI